MKALLNRLFLIGLVCLLGGLMSACSRYSLGGIKPQALKEVESLHIEMFQNATYYPRAEVLLTSAVNEAIASDGSYQLKPESSANATIKGRINNISLQQIRSQRYDTYQSLQTEMVVEVQYQVVRNTDQKVLKHGSITCRSEYFNLGNEQSDRWNAFSFAARRSAGMIVTEISNSY